LKNYYISGRWPKSTVLFTSGVGIFNWSLESIQAKLLYCMWYRRKISPQARKILAYLALEQALFGLLWL
jgi:hypothetical protein